MSAPPSLPVVAGLFVEEPDGVRLLATRCTSCGTTYFPRCATCRNPACVTKAVTDDFLQGAGTLYSYTIQRYQPPPLFRVNDWRPYAIGVVDLGAGMHVMGMLDGVPLDEVRIGLALRLTTRELYRDDEGRPVVTYAFMPEAESPR